MGRDGTLELDGLKWEVRRALFSRLGMHMVKMILSVLNLSSGVSNEKILLRLENNK